MTLKAARELRDMIRGRGLHCTVPLGNAPDRYKARICGINGVQDFSSEAEWKVYECAMDERKMKRELMEQLASRPRSPIERMVDRACGLE